MVISSIVRHVSGPVESWFQLPNKIDQVADIKLRSRCSYRMILLPYSSGACWKHYSHHIAHSVFVRCLVTMLRRLVNTRHTQLSWRSTTHNLLWMSLSIDKFDPMRYAQYYYCCYRLPKMSIVQRHIIDQLKISVFYLFWMFCHICMFHLMMESEFNATFKVERVNNLFKDSSWIAYFTRIFQQQLKWRILSQTCVVPRTVYVFGANKINRSYLVSFLLAESVDGDIVNATYIVCVLVLFTVYLILHIIPVLYS